MYLIEIILPMSLLRLTAGEIGGNFDIGPVFDFLGDPKKVDSINSCSAIFYSVDPLLGSQVGGWHLLNHFYVQKMLSGFPCHWNIFL